LEIEMVVSNGNSNVTCRCPCPWLWKLEANPARYTAFIPGRKNPTAAKEEIPIAGTGRCKSKLTLSISFISL
jgi:hypothetical protein